MKAIKTQNKRTYNRTGWRTAIAIMVFLLHAAGIAAQVTIGAGDPPQNFSIMEIISNQKRGLRMPLLTTTERNDMTATTEFDAVKTTLAKGLTIYNTTTNCLEFWNGAKWIARCEKEEPVTSPDATVTACARSGVLTAVNDDTGYYMFTYQTLNLYANSSSGTPTSYQWMIDGNPVSGATADTYIYTPAADIALEEDELGNYKKTVTVTCRMGIGGNEVFPENNFEILVVRATKGTLTPIYVWAHENGVAEAPLVKVAFAHVNLGAENDTNPCDCKGDLYQWGRVRDGNGTSTGHFRRNLAGTDVLPNGIGTAVTEALGNAVPAQDSELNPATGQVLSSSSKYGKFIKALSTSGLVDWRVTENNNLLGDVSTNDDYDRAKGVGDPCPDGWKVPTLYQWSALYRGANTSGTNLSGPPASATASTWTKQGVITANGSGGYKVADALYFPITGYRAENTASLTYVGNNGYYWTSAARLSETSPNHSWCAMITNTMINPNAIYQRARGMAIRCVPELSEP